MMIKDDLQENKKLNTTHYPAPKIQLQSLEVYNDGDIE